MKKNRGFTILDLVTVVVILVVAMALIIAVAEALTKEVASSTGLTTLKAPASEFIQWKSLGDGLWGGDLGGGCYQVLTDRRQWNTGLPGFFAFHEALARLIKEENLVVERVTYFQSSALYGINIVARKVCLVSPIPMPMRGDSGEPIETR